MWNEGGGRNWDSMRTDKKKDEDCANNDISAAKCRVLVLLLPRPYTVESAYDGTLGTR